MKTSVKYFGLAFRP